MRRWSFGSRTPTLGCRRGAGKRSGSGGRGGRRWPAERSDDRSHLSNPPPPPPPPRPPPPQGNVVNFSDVTFAYPKRGGVEGELGPVLFRNVSFGIDSRSRIALVGANGAGKSTLINLMVGLLAPVRGLCQRELKIRWGVFSQHHVDDLELHLTPLGALCRAFPKASELEVRTHLGSFGVVGDMALRPIYTLSGGQKSRVALAKVAYPKPHALLLDEPSNHLDIDSVDALAHAVNTFPGAVVMVSHDQHLIEATMDELWIVQDRGIKVFHGSFGEYKKNLARSLRA